MSNMEIFASLFYDRKRHSLIVLDVKKYLQLCFELFSLLPFNSRGIFWHYGRQYEPMKAGVWEIRDVFLALPVICWLTLGRFLHLAVPLLPLSAKWG